MLTIQGRTAECAAILAPVLPIAAAISAETPDVEYNLTPEISILFCAAETKVAAAKTSEELAAAEADFRSLIDRLEAIHRSHKEMPLVRTTLAGLYVTCPITALRKPERAIELLTTDATRGESCAMPLGQAFCELGRWQDAIAVAEPYARRLRQGRFLSFRI